MADVEVNCGTCVYAHCHPQDYPCCVCNPHTLDRWAGLKMFGVEFGAAGPREEMKRYDDSKRIPEPYTKTKLCSKASRERTDDGKI